jgi:hypothetical protein
MNDHDRAASAVMGAAIMKGVLIGLPTVIAGLTVAVWLITDLDMVDSFVTAILPGVLLGVFGGGFAGMATTMQE